MEAGHRPGRRDGGGQGRRGDHAPDEPGRELAAGAAVDRAEGEAVPPPDAQPHRLREEDRGRYSITCANIPDSGIGGVPGSHHPQYIDVAHREHAVVETGGVRTAKAMGLRNLPSKSWQVNKGWVLAANIAADLAAWTRLLGHCDDRELRDAGPGTLRYRIWHIPARLARHARQRILKISPGWPWTEAFLTCWQRPCTLPAPALPAPSAPATRKEARPARSEPAPTRAPPRDPPGKQTDNRPETRHQHNQ